MTIRPPHEMAAVQGVQSGGHPKRSEQAFKPAFDALDGRLAGVVPQLLVDHALEHVHLAVADVDEIPQRLDRMV